MFIRSASSRSAVYTSTRSIKKCASLILPALVVWIAIPGTVLAQITPPIGQASPDSLYNVQSFGAKADGTTDNAAAINLAFQAAAVTCGIVHFPSAPNAYVIKSQIAWPPCVSIRGDGPSEANPGAGFAGSNIQVSGKFVGILAQSVTDGSYPKQGFIEELGFSGFDGADGAVSAFQIIGRSHIVIRHVFVGVGGGPFRFSQAGIRLASNLEVSMYDCLIQNSGSAQHAAVEVDGTAAAPSTTFHWFNNRISGNPSAIAGLMLDRVGGFVLIGGNIESSGVSIKIASQSESKYPTGPGVIMGMDLEIGSLSVDHYIDCGYGWTGKSEAGCKQIHFSNNSLYPSGATTVTYGIQLANSYAVSAGTNTVALVTPPTAIFLLHGNANSGFTISGTTGSSGTQTLVSIDGVADPWGSINAPYYYQDGHASSTSFGGSVAASSCTAFPIASVRGANPGMACSVAPTVDPGPQFTWSCFVQGPDNVQVRLCNTTSIAATAAPTMYNVSVTH